MPVSAPDGLAVSDPITWPSRRVTSMPTRRRLSTSELFAIGTGQSANEDPGELVVGDLPVALVASERARINPMRTTSAQGMPVVEMLAAMASTDPTGVLALESADGRRGFAFEVVGGRVTGAQGTGDYGQLERWSAGIHARFPERFKGGEDGPLWVQLARTFISTRLVDELTQAEEVGTQMTFVRGEVQWIGTRLPAERGVRLGHLLLEYARVRDELPKLEQRLGSTSQLVVPISHPGDQGPAATKPADPDGWGSFDEPDPEHADAWKDARAVWTLCDGVMSIEELVDAAMIGRYRTLSAIRLLRDGGHVVLGEAPDRIRRSVAPLAPVLPFVGPSSRAPRSVPPKAEPTRAAPTAAPVERKAGDRTIVVDSRVLGSLAVRPAMVRNTIETFIGACPDWMAELEAGLRRKQMVEVRRAGVRITGAARAVGAGLLGSFTAMIVALADDGEIDTALGMMDELEVRYGQTFRELMELHASLG